VLGTARILPVQDTLRHGCRCTVVRSNGRSPCKIWSLTHGNHTQRVFVPGKCSRKRHHRGLLWLLVLLPTAESSRSGPSMPVRVEHPARAGVIAHVRVSDRRLI
jgi:hypothetical protein